MHTEAKSLVLPFAAISLAHILAFVTSIYLLLPLQAQYTPELAPYASLLFLPHGVRILSAWLMGWKSIPLFAPTALLGHWLIFGADGFTLVGIIGVFPGIICATLTFWALSKVGMDFRLTADKSANWRDVMLAGCIASIINTFGIGWVLEHNMATLGVWFVGDITGLFACMFLLMLFFKATRSATNRVN